MYSCVRGQRSCIRVLKVSILPLSAILIFYCGIVPTVWYCLFLILLLIYVIKHICLNYYYMIINIFASPHRTHDEIRGIIRYRYNALHIQKWI